MMQHCKTKNDCYSATIWKPLFCLFLNLVPTMKALFSLLKNWGHVWRFEDAAFHQKASQFCHTSHSQRFLSPEH